jgi:ATP-dependent Zn protease
VAVTKLDKRQATAYHEAGHAVIGRVLGLVCGEVTVVPNIEDSVGHAHVENPIHRWERGDGSRTELADSFCISLYAGAEAEKTILGSNDVGDGPDCDRATACLKIIGVRGAAFVGDDVWERHEDRLRQKAARLVRLHRHQIEIVAQALLECGTLQAEEIDALLQR